MRDDVLRDLARRAATDHEFLRSARQDLPRALARYGYDLTGEELAAVENVRRQTAGLDDAEVARAIAGGLERRPKPVIARPAAPGRRGAGPARPGRPGTSRGR